MTERYPIIIKEEGDGFESRGIMNNIILCQCCCSTSNLQYMTQTFLFEDQFETYLDILYSCFTVKVEEKPDSIPMICECCTAKLRDTYTFKLQVQTAQDKLRKIAEETEVNHTDNNENNDSIDIKSEDDADYQLDSIFDDGSDEVIDISKFKKNKLLKRKTLRNIEDCDDKHEKPKKKRKKLKGQRKYKTKNDKNKLKCKMCDEEFESKRFLSRHMKNHEQLFICHVCGKESPTKKLLLSHVISHSTEKVQCNICSKLLKKGSLLRHVQNHSGNMYIYPCKLCPEKFPSYNTRLYHLAVAHGLDEKKYACKVCDKAFRFSGGLSTHIKRCHLQEKKCVCTECDKSFFSKNELLKHMLKHTKARTFQCEVCLKSYGRKSTLQSHIKIHSNIKAHKCPICFREFTQKCTLTCHMKVHEKMNALQIHQDK